MLTDDEICAITRKQWLEYRIMFGKTAKPAAMPTMHAPAPTTPSPTSVDNELQNFYRGVKRDKTQYPVLKDERKYDNWERSFLATARWHRIEHVFDRDYSPTDPKEQTLFDEQKKFAYSVLDATLLTDKGKSLV